MITVLRIEPRQLDTPVKNDRNPCQIGKCLYI